MDVRHCEAPDCGMKLPPYVPRIRREDGLLVCPNCIEGRPGRPRAHATLTPAEEGTTMRHNAGRADVDYVIRSTGDGFEMLAGPFEQPEGAYPSPEWDAYEAQTAAALAQYPGAELVSAESVGSFVGLVDKRTAKRASVDGDFIRLLDRIRPGLGDAYEADDYSESYDAIFGTLTPEERAEINEADTERTRLLYGSSLRTVAHDSGDGKTIYHCPFCGAGQVVAGSDGTTECQFCHTFFTVQVQPEFASFPQTINGQPVQVPGMPGDPTQPSPSPDGPAGGDEGTAFQPPDQPDAFQPPDQPDVPEDKPNPFQGSRVAARPSSVSDHEATPEWDTAQFSDLCDTCGWPVTKKGDTWVHDEKNPVQWSDKRKEARRLYVVPEGVAIPEDSFMRRLALEHAPDREALLADLRASR